MLAQSQQQEPFSLFGQEKTGNVIDKGESSAIALALETPNSVLILDDFKARKVANQLGLLVTGTIGVIIRAKLNGIIPSIKPCIEKIKETNFRISIEIELQALKEANEL